MRNFYGDTTLIYLGIGRAPVVRRALYVLFIYKSKNKTE